MPAPTHLERYKTGFGGFRRRTKIWTAFLLEPIDQSPLVIDPTFGPFLLDASPGKLGLHSWTSLGGAIAPRPIYNALNGNRLSGATRSSEAARNRLPERAGEVWPRSSNGN